MKKYFKYLSILLLFLGCNKNVTNLETVIKDRRVRTLVNEYVENVLHEKSNDNIYIAGNIEKDPNIIEMGLYNIRPVFYTDNSADSLNTYIKSKQYGIFKYKGITFYVTNDLKDIFNLSYKTFDQVKSKFDTEDISEPTEYYSMFININKKDSSIIYSSNISKESLNWKKME